MVAVHHFGRNQHRGSDQHYYGNRPEIHLFGEQGGWLAILLIAPLIWIFGEIVPKSVFQQHADAITPPIIYVLSFASYLFSPVLIIFTYLPRLLTRLLGDTDQNHLPCVKK